MTKITRDELTRLLAEKVMGWRKSWTVGLLRDWNPLEDANHALQVLKALGKEYGIAYGSGGYCVSIYGVSIKCRTTHKSNLNQAVCLAVAEAETGIKYELED